MLMKLIQHTAVNCVVMALHAAELILIRLPAMQRQQLFTSERVISW